jgi:hypothetical protein
MTFTNYHVHELKHGDTVKINEEVATVSHLIDGIALSSGPLVTVNQTVIYRRNSGVQGSVRISAIPAFTNLCLDLGDQWQNLVQVQVLGTKTRT